MCRLATSATLSETLEWNSFIFLSFFFFLSVWSLDWSLCRYPKDTKPKFNNLKSKKASSFHEFARSTNDAWDIDDEEDEDFLGTPAPASLPSGLQSMSTQGQVSISHHFYPWAIMGVELVWNERRYSGVSTQQQQNQAGDTETWESHRLAPPRTEAEKLQDVQEEDTECEHVNGKVVRSCSDAHLNTSSGMWVICCSTSFSSKSYWAAYQVIHSEAN